jgi:predicted RNA-binding protein YlxR (DUF448 family)
VTPRRTCIGCRASVTPDDGVRVARRADGSLVVGRGQPGRGAWLCGTSTAACARAATKRRAWSRALRADVAPAAVEDLLRLVEGPDAGVGAGSPER